MLVNILIVLADSAGASGVYRELEVEDLSLSCPANKNVDFLIFFIAHVTI